MTAISNITSAPQAAKAPSLTPRQAEDALLAMVNSVLAQAGLEAIHAEIEQGRAAVLRLFIDRPEGITLDDCAEASRLLDEPLDQSSIIASIFPSGYELEVSSPGVDRPLRRLKDFERFQGSIARITLMRAAGADELENADYAAKNPKQKNYVGKILGTLSSPSEKVFLDAQPRWTDTSASGANRKKGQRPSKHAKSGSEELLPEWRVALPLDLISKAHLEPQLSGSEVESK